MKPAFEDEDLMKKRREDKEKSGVANLSSLIFPLGKFFDGRPWSINCILSSVSSVASYKCIHSVSKSCMDMVTSTLYWPTMYRLKQNYMRAPHNLPCESKDFNVAQQWSGLRSLKMDHKVREGAREGQVTLESVAPKRGQLLLPQNIRGSDEIIRVPKVIVIAMKFLTEWGLATDFNKS